MVGAEGLERRSGGAEGQDTPGTDQDQSLAKQGHTAPLTHSTTSAEGQSGPGQGHTATPFSHENYAHSMHKISPDLKDVIDSWDSLPDAIKVGILAMIKAARTK